MIKAVFFDIDGTLISFKTHTMPDTAKTALQALRKRGIKVFIATGRAPRNAAFVREYFDFDGMVTFNGQYCFDQNGVIHSTPLNSDNVRQIIPYMDEKKIATCFETLEKSVFNRVDKLVSDLQALVGMTALQPVIADIPAIRDDFYQMTCYVTPENEPELMRRLPDCKSMRWHPTFVNIIGKSGGKSIGISKVSERYGFDKSEIMTFGDGGNDADMLAYAGVGVAMGNAADDVKSIADYVTNDVDNDGIFNALKHFELI